MKRLIKRLINRNIVKILTIYKKSLEEKDINFRTNLQNEIISESDYLIKIIKGSD